jgi:hypothetical protein
MNKQDNELLLIPCAIESVATRRDKTLKVVIGTQELTPKVAAELFNQWTAGVGIMAFKGESFTIDDKQLIESIKIDSNEFDSKTPSQRLRSCLYVLYEKNNDGFKTFGAYYESMMDMFCNMVKKKIDAKQL